VYKDRITVVFNDQGKGMTAEKLKSLFNIHEFGNAGDNDIKGAGIALSICQDMLHRMNGKLWAKSEVGTGTTFYYSLPLMNGCAL
jgi:signal transduction histidine kinase